MATLVVTEICMDCGQSDQELLRSWRFRGICELQSLACIGIAASG
jgi:hypothetical protein